MRIVVAALLGAVAPLTRPEMARADSLDPELWVFNHLMFERTKERELSLTVHGRANEIDSPSLYQIQPRLAVPLSSWLWAGVNYSYFGIRTTGAAVDDEDLFTNQHRFEGELQIRSTLRDGIRYVGRNRFEHLLNEGMEEVNNRFRHRSQFVFDSPLLPAGNLVSQIELFHDFRADRLNQTRTAPLGVRVPLSAVTLQAQPMVIHLYRPGEGWLTRLVANLEVTYEF